MLFIVDGLRKIALEMHLYPSLWTENYTEQ